MGRKNGSQVSGHPCYGRQPGDRFPTAFGQRCTEKLEQLGDVAADAQQHNDAILQYSAALSLNLPFPQILVKRSKVYLAMGLWEDALHDANQARNPYFGWAILIDAKSLGSSPSIISMGPRAGVDGMDEGKFNKWFVEGSIGCCS